MSLLVPLTLEGEQFERAKERFVYWVKQMDLPGTPEVIEWSSPMRVIGPPWLAGMWMGWLLRTQKGGFWREADFDGQFVNADMLVAEGYLIHPESASCSRYQVRVEVEDVEKAAGGDGDALARLTAAAQGARKRFAERDKHLLKRGKQK